MIIDGRQIAREVRAQLQNDIAALGRPLTLGFVRSGDDLVAKKFVDMKSRTAAELGIRVLEFPLPPDADTETAIAAVEKVAAQADGVLVQMPLGKNIDAEKVLATVPLEKDVDAMGERSGQRVLTPVVAAIEEILRRQHISVAGKKAVVVGHGRLVGAPAASWLRSEGAEVSVATRESAGIGTDTKNADIIVLGAGRPGILQPDMISNKAVILDAGTSESEGAVKGDADPACAEVAAIFTPVPGGIGPIAVAMIFKNLLELARRQH